MNREEYEVMYRVEGQHWWYLGMERITCSLLDRVVGGQPSLRILDAGCGTGAVMSYLARYGTVAGFDFSTEALRFCHQRNLTRLAQASVVDIPFADNTFDLIVSFDVICEQGVPDDRQALRELARVLKPGGRLLLRLPAYKWLRGKHDVAVHLSHRYTAREIKSKFDHSGFTTEHLSYANTFLFPIAALKRFTEPLLARHQQGSDLTLNPGPFNDLLRSILSAEAPLVRSIGLPFGLTVVALGRKK
jgi:SAM-dependent methyltransferase